MARTLHRVARTDGRRGPVAGMLWLRAAALLALCAAGTGAQEPTAAAWPRTAADAELEDFLERARVVEAREIGSGITKPLRLLLEHQGRTMMAAFKSVDLYRPGLRRQPGFPPEKEFTDDYRFERAAYLLDRELELGMVPVVVLRKWQGRPGAAVVWVADAIDEADRRERGLMPSDPLILGRQKALMRVFDALILNTDRNLSNQLITPADWKLHLIDHSRSFRLAAHLPDRFRATPVKLSHRLLARLEALEAEPLQRLFRRLIGKGKIAALLARRDQILAKVEADRGRYGDGYVFSVDPPTSGGPEGAPDVDGAPEEDDHVVVAPEPDEAPPPEPPGLPQKSSIG